MGVDPIPTSAESMTVYQYGGNNPVMMNDPMGDKAKFEPITEGNPFANHFGEAEHAQGQAEDLAWQMQYGGGFATGGGSGFGSPITTYNYMGIPGAISVSYYNGTNGTGSLSMGIAAINQITGGAVGSAYASTAASATGAALGAAGYGGGYGSQAATTLGRALPEVSITAFRNNVLPSWWGDSQRFIGNPEYYGPAADIRSLANTFSQGFLSNSNPTNESSGSFVSGYGTLPATVIQKVAPDVASIVKGLKVSTIATRLTQGLGVTSAVFTGIEDLTSPHGWTWGTTAKVGIGLLTTFTPYGWVYGVVDLGIQMYSNTSLTDRIGHGIDNFNK